MKTSLVVVALAVSFGIGSAAGQKNDPSITAITDFIATWGLPLEGDKVGDLKPMGTRTIPGMGRVRRVALDGHVFDVSSKGHVVGFSAARRWRTTCEASARADEPAALVRQRLPWLMQSWARGARTVRGRSWLPELESHQGRVMVLLREPNGLVEGRAAYRNYAQAIFDAGRCLLVLSVSDASETRSVAGAITKQEAMGRANAWLEKRGSGSTQAVDASLEVRFVAGRAVLVWVPEELLDGDLTVATSVWVDAGSGRCYRAPAQPESLRLDTLRTRE
jgi:hypothetical protein